MNDLVKQTANQISVADFDAMFSAADSIGDLTQNVESGGFPTISFRGGKWRVKSAGEEYLIVNDEDEPAPSILVNFLKASKYVSRTYYADSYEEGDDEAPACMSINGMVPDEGVDDPQATNCSSCPQNAWGSRITESGTKAKACGSRRRIAVAPMFPIPDEAPHELMLFTVPTTSLKDLQAFGRKMEVKGFPYQQAIIRLGLDVATSYPRPTFKPERALTADDKTLIVDFINESGGMAKVEDMLEVSGVRTEDGDAEAAAAIEAAAEKAAEAAAAEKKAAAAAEKKATAAAKRKAKKAAKKAASEPALAAVPDTPAGDVDDADAALDDIFAGMDMGS